MAFTQGHSGNAGQKSSVLPEEVLFYPQTAYQRARLPDAARVWEQVSREQGGIDKNLAAALIFVHHYAVRFINSKTSEWIVIVQERTAGGRRFSLLRLDFETLRLKYKTVLPVVPPRPIQAQEAAGLINRHPKYPHGFQVHPEQLEAVGDYFIYFQEAADFGGSAVVSRTCGQLLFAAGTIAMGTGKLVFPPSAAFHPADQP